MHQRRSRMQCRGRTGRAGWWHAGWGLRVSMMAVVIWALVLARSSPAAEFTCAGGDVTCLIAAINAANTNGQANTITLAAGTYPLTAVENDTDGPNGLPSVTSMLTLRGAGAKATIIDRAGSAPAFRLVHVAAVGRLTLEGLALRGGNVAGRGGGIRNSGTLTIMNSTLASNQTTGTVGTSSGGGIENTGTLTIMNSTLVGNSSGGRISFGGGIDNTGTLTIMNSTLAGNSSSGFMLGSGGGISNRGTVTIMNSTLAGNSASPLATGGGGGIENTGILTIMNSTLADNRAIPSGGGLSNRGTVALQNTVLARNTGGMSGPDCSGRVTSRGHNLIGDPAGCAIDLQATDLTGDPGLGAFTNDGTPGQGYVPLLSDSPALDAGDPAACPATDQLGQLRVTPCDIGAIEFAPVILTLGLHQTTFRAGETLRVGLGMHNPGPPVTADAYLGVFLPDGVTVLFVTSLAPLDGVVTRLDADPRMFAPLATAVEFPLGLEATVEDFFVYTITGGESPGAYTIFTLLTPPGVFEDGQVDAGDLLGLTLQPFTVSP